MDLYGQKGNSLPQKTMLLTLELIFIALSYWILFSSGYEKLFTASIPGNSTRHTVLFLFNCIVFLRMCATIFYFMKRKMPWEEAFSIPFAFALYYIGFALLGYSSAAPIEAIDIFGIALFLLGSWLNSYSEWQRDQWKKLPAHKGHLFTTGLFRYSMHINYFGDLLWVTAYALLTHNWYSAIIPVLIFCFFAFYNIPKLDAYLASKYGQEFAEYAGKTRKFIPFIY